MDSLLKTIKDYINERSEPTICKDILKKVKKDPWGLMMEVPEEYMTQEMCDSVFEKIESLSCIPERFRTLEMCRKAVRGDPFFYRYVPEIFSEDLEIIKAVKCKICCSKEGDISKCEDCGKVVCNDHLIRCPICSVDNDFLYCEDCWKYSHDLRRELLCDRAIPKKNFENVKCRKNVKYRKKCKMSEKKK